MISVHSWVNCESAFSFWIHLIQRGLNHCIPSSEAKQFKPTNNQTNKQVSKQTNNNKINTMCWTVNLTHGSSGLAKNSKFIKVDFRFPRTSPGQGCLFLLFPSIITSPGRTTQKGSVKKRPNRISFLIHLVDSVLPEGYRESWAQDSTVGTQGFWEFQSLEFWIWGPQLGPYSTACGFSSAPHHPEEDFCVFICASPGKYLYLPVHSIAVECLGQESWALFFYVLHYLEEWLTQIGILDIFE